MMRLEKHGRGVESAWRMLDVFTSVGVHSLDLTRTDLDGHKRFYRAMQSVETLRSCMPWLMRSAIEGQHNLIVRPRTGSVELIQLDDLCGAGLERVKDLAFLVLQTSAGN